MNMKVLAGMRFIARPNGDRTSLPSFVMTLYTGGPIRPLNWRRDEPVVIDLAGMAIPPHQKIPINKDHVIDVGHSTSVNVIGSELIIEGILSGWSKTAKDTPATEARQIARLGKNGFPWQASMEARVDHDLESIASGQSVVINKQTQTGPLCVARSTTLIGAAILSIGADTEASVAIAAAPTETEQADIAAAFAAGYPVCSVQCTNGNFFVVRRILGAALDHVRAMATNVDAVASITTPEGIKLLCHRPDVAKRVLYLASDAYDRHPFTMFADAVSPRDLESALLAALLQ
jgi:hypothetical protein